MRHLSPPLVYFTLQNTFLWFLARKIKKITYKVKGKKTAIGRRTWRKNTLHYILLGSRTPEYKQPVNAFPKNHKNLGSTISLQPLFVCRWQVDTIAGTQVNAFSKLHKNLGSTVSKSFGQGRWIQQPVAFIYLGRSPFSSASQPSIGFSSVLANFWEIFGEFA